MHKLQLGFVIFSIAPIELIYFSTLNYMRLHRYVRDVLELKWCSKWAENKSDFCLFLRRRRRLEKLPSIIFMNVYWVLPK